MLDRSSAGQSRSSTLLFQLPRKKAPRVGTPEKQGALAATTTPWSRKSESQGAISNLQMRKREPSRAGEVDKGWGEIDHTHPYKLGGATLPSEHPKAKTNAEEHIQHANPKGQQERHEGGTPSMTTGRPLRTPAGGHGCRSTSIPHSNSGRERMERIPRNRQSLNRKAHPRPRFPPK